MDVSVGRRKAFIFAFNWTGRPVGFSQKICLTPQPGIYIVSFNDLDILNYDIFLFL